MPADRFFLDSDFEESAILEGPEHHHLAHVMRCNVGDEIELVNGRGDLALGKITQINKKNAGVQILKSSHEKPKAFQFQLAVPLMRPSKLEWVVEKGTELGASAFLFYPAAFAEKEALTPRNLERLHLIVISALKQSGRLYLPSIEILSHFEHLFAKEAVIYFGDPKGKERIELSKLTIFISGPEKGFSQEELALLKGKAKGVSLSPYILRAETAPIAVASILGHAIFEGKEY